MQGNPVCASRQINVKRLEGVRGELEEVGVEKAARHHRRLVGQASGRVGDVISDAPQFLRRAALQLQERLVYGVAGPGDVM